MARDFSEEVTFFGIAWQATEAESRAYVEEFDVPYRNALDDDAEVFVAYGVPYQPATVLITPEGEIFDHIVGGVDHDFLTERVNALLSA